MMHRTQIPVFPRRSEVGALLPLIDSDPIWRDPDGTYRVMITALTADGETVSISDEIPEHPNCRMSFMPRVRTPDWQWPPRRWGVASMVRLPDYVSAPRGRILNEAAGACLTSSDARRWRHMTAREIVRELADG